MVSEESFDVVFKVLSGFLTQTDFAVTQRSASDKSETMSGFVRHTPFVREVVKICGECMLHLVSREKMEEQTAGQKGVNCGKLTMILFLIPV